MEDTCKSRCCHACGHEHSHEEGSQKSALIILGGAAVMFALALILPVPLTPKVILFLASYLVAGREVLLTAWKNILKGEVFDENFLMAIASIGAFMLGEYPEGVAVMLFYQLGEIFQGLAVDRSRKSIKALMDIRPDRANVMIEGKVEERAAEEIQPGDVILILAGERVPLDGVVLEGASQLDTSALTGESMPHEIAPGNDVLAGCVNLSGTLTVRVTKPFMESTAAKILELVEHASANKAPAEQFITKFAHYYTPAVVGIAVLIAVLPPLFAMGGWSEYIHRALIFLVISCPCALVLSVPMGYFAGIGCASKSGILVKGGNYLEALSQPKIVVFDKTGTLTHGALQVSEIIPAAMDQSAVLMYAAYAETNSNHPIAQSIRSSYPYELDRGRIGETKELAGNGLSAVVDGKQILAGNRRLMESAGIFIPEALHKDTPVYIAVDGVHAGTILIGDSLKEDAADILKQLRDLGIGKTVMLTGDLKSTGEKIGREVGIDEVRAELLPADKVTWVESLQQEARKTRGKLLYIGDGINDAPVLTRADIGIAMGGLGADAAIEAADVVIMDDKLDRIPLAIRIARKTRSVVIQNIILVLLVKVVFLILGSLGLATMWEAVFADVGVSLLAVLSSLRALRAPKELKAA